MSPIATSLRCASTSMSMARTIGAPGGIDECWTIALVSTKHVGRSSVLAAAMAEREFGLPSYLRPSNSCSKRVWRSRAGSMASPLSPPLSQRSGAAREDPEDERRDSPVGAAQQAKPGSAGGCFPVWSCWSFPVMEKTSSAAARSAWMWVLIGIRSWALGAE